MKFSNKYISLGNWDYNKKLIIYKSSVTQASVTVEVSILVHLVYCCLLSVLQNTSSICAIVLSYAFFCQTVVVFLCNKINKATLRRLTVKLFLCNQTAWKRLLPCQTWVPSHLWILVTGGWWLFLWL